VLELLTKLLEVFGLPLDLILEHRALVLCKGHLVFESVVESLELEVLKADFSELKVSFL